MSHYAKVLNQIVQKVIVADAEFFDTFVDDSPGSWIQTSYNTRGGVHYQPNSNIPSEDQTKALRKNYAGIGMTYDSTRDAFIPEKPFNSWVLDETSCLWDPPITRPSIQDDGADPIIWRWNISWNDNAYQADNTKGWEATKKNMDGTAHSDTAKYDWNGTAWIAQ